MDLEKPTIECVSVDLENYSCFTDCGPIDCRPDDCRPDDCNPDDCNPDD